MSSRRQFLTTLGKALGAGGVLLPLAGKGTLAISEPAKAAQIPVSAAPMPWSPECLELRQLKQRMLKHQVAKYSGHYGRDHERACTAWRLLMCDYGDVAETIAARPNPTWRDATELAEIAWHMAHKQRTKGDWHGEFTGRLSLIDDGSSRDPAARWLRQVHIALVETVLTLGGGERFDPREGLL
jgi:hypothetical protein